MRFDPNRLRRGELFAGGGALLLFLSLFFVDWYSVADIASVNGWHGHTVLRWLMLLTIVAGVALVVATATQSTPALPVSLAVIVTALAGFTTVLVAYRVLLNEPGPNAFISVDAGAYLGLIALLLVTYGGYATMRTEGNTFADVPVQARRLA